MVTTISSQVRQLVADQKNFICENNAIELKALGLPFMGEDTIFSSQFIAENELVFQRHLQRVADYLLPGPGVWWSHSADGSVCFQDSIGNPETRPDGPKVAHFRSSSVAEEVKKVQTAWKECLELKVELPIKRVRFEDSNGQLKYVKWPPTERDVVGAADDHDTESGQEHADSARTPGSQENTVDDGGKKTAF